MQWFFDDLKEPAVPGLLVPQARLSVSVVSSDKTEVPVITKILRPSASQNELQSLGQRRSATSHTDHPLGLAC